MNINDIITKSLQYLTDPEPQSPSANDQISALACGFQAALHRHRYYSNILVDNAQSIEQRLVASLKAEHFAATDVFLARSELVLLLNPDDDYLSDKSLKNLFILGYRAALHLIGKYDDALFLEGHQLEICIYVDLLALQKSQENARRAQARIVLDRKKKLNRDQLRCMVLSDKRINDDGQPVDEFGKVIPSAVEPSSP